MREWDGIHDDMAPVGEGPFILLQNVTLRTQGQLERRGVIANRIATGLIGLRCAPHETTGVGSWMLIGTSTTVQGVNLVSGLVTAVLTGLTNSTYYPSFSYINQYTYVSNGVDAMRYIKDGATVGGNAGLAAPVGAPAVVASAGGNVTVGTHLVRYRLYDATRNTYSDPSPATSITVAAPNQTLTVTAPGSVVVEVTLASGAVYYQNPGVLVITQTDQQLSVATAVNTYAGPDGYGFEVPPICRLSCIHRGRVFLWGPPSGTIKDLIYWSRFGFPEAFRANVWARSGTLAYGDVPSAIMSYQDDLYLIGRRSMTRLIYTADPADGILSPIPTNLGAFNQACVLAVDAAIYGFGRNGIWKVTGIMPKYLSGAIEDTLLADIDLTKPDDCFVSYDGIQRVVRFHYSSTVNGRGKRAVAYHVDEDKWTIDTFLNELSCAAQASTPTGNTYLYAVEGITYAGDLWTFVMNVPGDGWLSTVTNGAFVSLAGSTSTVANITPSTSGSAFIGAYLYRPATGESQRITANSTSTVTVGTPFGSAIATGEELYIGPVDVRAKPFWSTLVGPQIARARPSYCIMEHASATAVTPEYRVQFYEDFSSTSTPATKFVTDTQPDGVAIPAASSSYVTATPVNGVASIPVPAEWNRVIRWDLQQIKPFGAIMLMDMRWSVDKNGILKERSQA